VTNLRDGLANLPTSFAVTCHKGHMFGAFFVGSCNSCTALYVLLLCLFKM